MLFHVFLYRNKQMRSDRKKSASRLWRWSDLSLAHCTNIITRWTPDSWHEVILAGLPLGTPWLGWIGKTFEIPTRPKEWHAESLTPSDSTSRCSNVTCQGQYIWTDRQRSVGHSRSQYSSPEQIWNHAQPEMRPPRVPNGLGAFWPLFIGSAAAAVQRQTFPNIDMMFYVTFTIAFEARLWNSTI